MNLSFRVIAIATVVVSGFLSTAQAAYVASLADDFTYAENNSSSTWSFGQVDDTAPPPLSLNLYDTVRNANEMWGALSPSVPQVWSFAGGGVYWGIGKNTTASPVTGTGLTWASGAVLLHPQVGNLPGRLAIVWTAPNDGIIDANWTFATATDNGNGVGLQLDKLSGGVQTTIPGYGFGQAGVTIDQAAYYDPNTPARISTPINGSLNSYNVLAGDKLIFQLDVWAFADAGGDNTSAAITITGTLVPEPSSLLMLSLGGAALICHARRRKNCARK